MKRTVLLASAALFVFLLCALAACGGRETLKLISVDFPDFTTVESRDITVKNLHEAERGLFTSEEKYEYHLFRIYERDGDIVLTESTDEFSEPGNYQPSAEYTFFGVDNGEWGGWVKYQRYATVENPEPEMKAVCSENLRGFISPAERRDVIVLTGSAHLGLDKGKLRYMRYDSEKRDYDCTQEIDLGSSPQAWYSDRETGTHYIFCFEKVVIYNENGTHTEIVYKDDLIRCFGAFCVIRIDGLFYLSNSSGIARYDIESNEFTWFPILIEKKR